MIKRTRRILVGACNLGSGANGIDEGQLVPLINKTDVIWSIEPAIDALVIARGLSNDIDKDPSAIKRETYRSCPILRGKVKSARYLTYDAPVEQVTTVTYTGLNLEDMSELTITILYQDTKGFMGNRQYRKTYSVLNQTGAVIAPNTNNTGYIDLLVAKINRDPHRRVKASRTPGSSILTLTALPIAAGRSSLNDIDEFTQVKFETSSIVSEINDNGLSVDNVLGEVAITQQPVRGTGYWASVRDIEKYCKAYDGLTNRTIFPVPSMDSTWMTGKDVEYDLLTIDHYIPYDAPDSYEKWAEHTTIIAIPHCNSTPSTDILTITGALVALGVTVEGFSMGGQP